MKHRWLLILLIIVALVGAGAYVLYQRQASSVEAATTSVQTGIITRGSLAATVSGAGNIYSPQQTDLSFELTGVPITTIQVQVGDQVKTGQVLALEDDSDLQFSLRTAQASLASAQASLDKLKQPPLETDVNAAKAELTSAQAGYAAAVNKNAHASDQLLVVKSALDKATATLQHAQAAYNRIAWRDDAPSSSEAATLASATADYQSALGTYNLAVVDINDSAVKSAAETLASAMANLATVTATATEQDLAVAQASVDSAQVVVEQAERKLDQAKIIAPFDGTIAAVNYVVGQLSPSGSTVISLVSLDNLQTQISLSEVDIAKVQADGQVTLEMDAISGQSFSGKVASISPVGTVTSGVVNYAVTVALTKSDPGIKPGMTATATFVVDQRDNVLMAPNKALKTASNQKVMTLLVSGKQVPVIVKTGLVGESSTEILSAASTDGQPVNLADGDLVVLNSTTTTTSSGGGPGLLGGLGGPGM